MTLTNPFEPPDSDAPADGAGLFRWERMSPSLRMVFERLLHFGVAYHVTLDAGHLLWVLCIEPDAAAALSRQLGDLGQLDDLAAQYVRAAEAPDEPWPQPRFAEDFLRIVDSSFTVDHVTGVDLLRAMLDHGPTRWAVRARRLARLDLRAVDFLPYLGVVAPKANDGEPFLPAPAPGHGVIVLRHDETTPMKVVYEVLLKAGFDGVRSYRCLLTAHHHGQAALASLPEHGATESAAYIRWLADRRGHPLRVDVMWP